MKQTLRKKKTMLDTFEPRREKTNILHMRKQRHQTKTKKEWNVNKIFPVGPNFAGRSG